MLLLLSFIHKVYAFGTLPSRPWISDGANGTFVLDKQCGKTWCLWRWSSRMKVVYFKCFHLYIEMFVFAYKSCLFLWKGLKWDGRLCLCGWIGHLFLLCKRILLFFNSRILLFEICCVIIVVKEKKKIGLLLFRVQLFSLLESISVVFAWFRSPVNWSGVNCYWKWLLFWLFGFTYLFALERLLIFVFRQLFVLWIILL